MRRTLLIAALLAVPAGVSAEDDLKFWDRLQIHGFASQVAVNTSANRYFGNSPDTSLDFRELGLNASYQLNPKILLAAQVLSRRAGDMYDGSPSLDYGLADITLASALERRFGVRVGRIKNPLGLYNETRDVPFTRPGIFLPQVVYYDKVRNLVISSDGVMFYGESFSPKGNVSLTLGGGQAVVDDNVEWAYLGGDYDGDLEPDGITWIGSLWYTTADERLKAGVSGASSAMQFAPGASSVLDRGQIDYLYWIASLQYNAEDFTLSAEYSRLPLEWRDFGPYFPFNKQTTEGYYFQGAYRIFPELEFTLRYEEGFADRRDRDGRRGSELTGGMTPPFDFYTKIFTAGLRWDVFPNLMLRAEYQRHQGTFALSIRENPDPSALVEDFDVFALSVSVRF